MKKTLLSLAMATSIALVSVSASAIGIYEEFTVNEASVPGTTSGSEFVADYINGTYDEKLVINADSSFTTTAFALFDAFKDTDGTSPVSPESFLGAPNGVGGYAMYALFTSSGTFTGTGFIGNNGSFDLYIDPNKDTILGFSGNTATASGVTTDDYTIAFADNLTLAAGIIGNASTSGSFDLYFNDFTLTTLGGLYFIQPRPFHLLINIDGDFNQFTFAPGGVFDVNGDVSAVFLPNAVPEPGTLALLGLGLLGMGMGMGLRRKS